MADHINSKINNNRINRFLRPVKYHSKYIYTLSPNCKNTTFNKRSYESYKDDIKIIENNKNIKMNKND